MAPSDVDDFLLTFRRNAQHHISGPAEDSALLPDPIMDTVHKDKRVDGIDRTELSLFDSRKDPVCDLTDHFSGHFNPIKVLKLVMDIPDAEASGILSSMPEISHWYLGMSFGSNYPLRSLGTSIWNSPYWLFRFCGEWSFLLLEETVSPF